MTSEQKINLMKEMYRAAVDIANPDNVIAPAVRQFLPDFPDGRLLVTGFGKASGVMARAFERALTPGQRDKIEGVVIVPDGHQVWCERVNIRQAAHPLPDERGGLAAKEIMALAKSAKQNDLLVVLISGGGSSLFCLPHPAIGMAAKQSITDQLLKNGAPIGAINCLRKHLSSGKGGRLAAMAYPAPVLAFAISDVPGDDPEIIASGPTVADSGDAAMARAILKRYHIKADEKVHKHLASPACKTFRAGDIKLKASHLHILATPQKSLEAAAAIARKAGYKPVIIGAHLEGESRDLAKQMARQANQSSQNCALISGGETTVAVKGTGMGGRNAEFLHALAFEGQYFALAADTDGIDGNAPVAGAYITPSCLLEAKAAGLDAEAMLNNNDSHSFFAGLGTQIITGPTKTNVNDFRVILT